MIGAAGRARLRAAAAIALLCGAPASQAQTARPAMAVGVSLPLSGASAEIGVSFLDGLRTCLASDPVGRGVTLKVTDDAEAELAAEDLRAWELPGKDSVIALTGFFGRHDAAEAAKRAAAARLPLVAPMSGAQTIMQDASGWVFPVRSPDRTIATSLVSQAARLGVKRLGAFATRDAAGAELLAVVRAAAAANGVQLVAVAEAETGSMELDPQARTLLSARPDAVLSLAGYTSTADVFMRLRRAGFVGQLLAHGDVGSRPLTRLMGPSARGVGIGLAVPSPANASLPLARDLEAAARKAGKAPDEFTLEGCMAARVISDGLRRAGSQPTRDSLRRALETNRSVDAGGITVVLAREDRERNVGELVVLGADGRILR